MEKSFLLLILLISSLFSGCEAVEEFINMKALKIESFSPSSLRILPDALSSVKITFSENMNRSRTEDSFSLEKESSPVNGKFRWEGRTLSFIPFSGFLKNSNYKAEVSSGAEDIYGNSLPEKFVFSFSTAEESEIPFLVSSEPMDGELIQDPLQIITVTYSEALSQDTVFAAFSIFPAIKGHLSLDNGDRSIIFTPLENFTEGSDYNVSLSEDLSDISGNRTGSKTDIYFKIAEEEIASLIWLGNTEGTEYENTENVFLNEAVEKDVKIRMVYDKEVSCKIKNSLLRITPEAECTIDWNTVSEEAVITFENNLDYNEVYEITADDKIYRLLINGAGSKPPELIKIVFCNDSSAPVFEELSLNRGICFETSENAFFDFYFILAEGASVFSSEIFSCISFKTLNSDLSVKPLRVLNPQTGIPAPSPPPEEYEYVFRIECSVTEGTQVSPFRIEINSEFSDSLSNRLEEEEIVQVTAL